MTKLDNVSDENLNLLFVGAGSLVIAALLYTIDLVSFQAAFFIVVASIVTNLVCGKADTGEPKHLKLYRLVTMVLWMPLFYVHFFDSWLMPILNGFFSGFSVK